MTLSYPDDSAAGCRSNDLLRYAGVFVGVAGLGWAYVLADGVWAYTVGVAGFVVLVASMMAAQVLRMVARTALYRYATADERGGPFAGRSPDGIFPER